MKRSFSVTDSATSVWPGMDEPVTGSPAVKKCKFQHLLRRPLRRAPTLSVPSSKEIAERLCKDHTDQSWLTPLASLTRLERDRALVESLEQIADHSAGGHEYNQPSGHSNSADCSRHSVLAAARLASTLLSSKGCDNPEDLYKNQQMRHYWNNDHKSSAGTAGPVVVTPDGGADLGFQAVNMLFQANTVSVVANVCHSDTRALTCEILPGPDSSWPQVRYFPFLNHLLLLMEDENKYLYLSLSEPRSCDGQHRMALICRQIDKLLAHNAEGKNTCPSVCFHNESAPENKLTSLAIAIIGEFLEHPGAFLENSSGQRPQELPLVKRFANSEAYRTTLFLKQLASVCRQLNLAGYENPPASTCPQGSLHHNARELVDDLLQHGADSPDTAIKAVGDKLFQYPRHIREEILIQALELFSARGEKNSPEQISSVCRSINFLLKLSGLPAHDSQPLTAEYASTMLMSAQDLIACQNAYEIPGHDNSVILTWLGQFFRLEGAARPWDENQLMQTGFPLVTGSYMYVDGHCSSVHLFPEGKVMHALILDPVGLFSSTSLVHKVCWELAVIFEASQPGFTELQIYFDPRRRQNDVKSCNLFALNDIRQVIKAPQAVRAWLTVCPSETVTPVLEQHRETITEPVRCDANNDLLMALPVTDNVHCHMLQALPPQFMTFTQSLRLLADNLKTCEQIEPLPGQLRQALAEQKQDIEQQVSRLQHKGAPGQNRKIQNCSTEYERLEECRRLAITQYDRSGRAVTPFEEIRPVFRLAAANDYIEMSS